MRPCGADKRGRRLPFDGVLKRTAAVVISAVVLTSMAPLIFVIAILLLAGGGPALRRDLTLGKGGLTFQRLRFHAAAKAGSSSWMPDYLKRSGLTDLPLFWNVLRGEMALVGPSPISPAQLREYGPQAQAYLALRPGLTGTWRLHSTMLPLRLRAQLDAAYESRRCVLLDARILLRSTFRIWGKQALPTAEL